jgi:hypothetical protein
MRIAVPVLALAVAACSSQSMQPLSAPAFRVVKAGSYGREATAATPGGPSKASVLVATTEADYRRLWDLYVGEGDAPPVNFASERVVFLLLGLRRTGGFAIDVNGVAIDNGALVVDAPVQRPPAGGMSTQALTAPWSVIAVKGPAFRDVRWRDRDQKELAATPLANR